MENTPGVQLESRGLIWLAVPRGAADVYVLYVLLCFGPMAITGNAPFGQSYLCHPFIYGSPISSLLSRTPITKYISSYKVSSSISKIYHNISTIVALDY